jgi:hypothetical protein
MAKTQTLSFPIRLPDTMQAEALRLLDTSREPINQIVTDLWPQLDLFTADRVTFPILCPRLEAKFVRKSPLSRSLQ